MMSLGTEVDLGPGHNVLDRVPALHEKGTTAPPLLGPCLWWPRSPLSATAELLCLYMRRTSPQREPPMFGRATITLGIGPHSNSSFLIETNGLLKVTVSHGCTL